MYKRVGAITSPDIEVRQLVGSDVVSFQDIADLNRYMEAVFDLLYVYTYMHIRDGILICVKCLMILL